MNSTDDAEWTELQQWRHALGDQAPKKSPVETMGRFKTRWANRVDIERAFLTRFIPPGAESNRLIQDELNRFLDKKRRENPDIEREWFRRGLYNECRRAIDQKTKRAESGAVIADVLVDFNQETMIVKCFTRLNEEQHEAIERVALRREMGLRIEKVD